MGRKSIHAVTERDASITSHVPVISNINGLVMRPSVFMTAESEHLSIVQEHKVVCALLISCLTDASFRKILPLSY